jgi:ATP-dependent helicase/nuclease subunit A
MTASRCAPEPPPDHEHRTRATTLFDRNLVVTAGAGTGKTAILVERALNLVGTGSATLDTMALITFTEKAAAELRLRLGRGLERLLRRAAGPAGEPLVRDEDGDRSWQWLAAQAVPAERVRSLAMAALQDLDGAAIGTIHSFCADILRRHPREAGVDPRFSVDDGVVFDRIFDEAWTRQLAADLGPAGTRAAAWRRALAAGDPPARVRDLALALADFTLPDEARAPASPPDPVALLGEAAREAVRGVRSVRDRGGGFHKGFQAFLDAAVIYLEAFLAGGVAGLRAARAPISIEKAASGTIGDPGRRATGVSAAEAEAGCAPARDLLRLLAGVEDEAAFALQAVAGPAAAAAGERLLAQGFVSFDAMLRRSRDVLARHPAVRRAIGRRFRRLLVDEFQDTDPLQYEILFFLAGGETPPAGDAWRTILEPGRLFIVGDPKQSIYRFRGADIAAYRRAVDHVTRCDGEVLRLTASFRSPASLLGPVNRLFEGWLGPAEGWDGDSSPPYDRIESARPERAGAGPRVIVASVDSSPAADARERRAAEAAAVAAWIAAHAGPAGSARPHRWGEIAILFRAMTHAGLFARALRGAAIPFVIEGGKDFHERAEVSDLLMLLRAAASPNDTPAILAVLRSPLGAVPDEELARFARTGGRLERPDTPAPEPALHPNLARALGWLDRFRAAITGLPADAVVEAAVSRTPLALLHAAAHDGPQRVQNLRKLASMARERAVRGLSLPEAIGVLDTAFAGRTPEGESPLADESHDAVRVLSIHKAKGLEYPVVFVPDLGREEGHGGPDNGSAASWVVRGGSAWLALRIDARRWNAAWALRALEDRRHESAEERRVFYVACTRARERLILVNSHRERRAPWRDRLAALGYRIGDDGSFPPEGLLAGGDVMHGLLSPTPATTRRDVPVDLGPIERAACAGRDTAAALAAASVPPLSSPSGTRSDDRPDPESLVRAAAPARPLEADGRRGADRSEIARLAGIAVHAALETWDLRDGDALLAGAAREARAAVDESPRAPGGADLAGTTARKTGVILRGFLSSPLPARLVAATVHGREVALLWRGLDGRTWTGACDILFEETGTLVVGDWKTDVTGGDPAAAAAPYREQLALYVAAVRAAFPGRQVRGEVLFVREGLAVPIDC